MEEYGFMKRLALLTLFCSLATGVIAAPNDGWNEGMILFKKGDTTNTNYYRIPAITTTSQGTIIAVADYRHNGYGDIGLNTGVDFAIKISHDGGNTWSDKTIITPENGLGISDPAIVHNSDTGRTFLFGYQNDKFITTKPTSEKSDFFMYTSDDGGKTWDKGQSLKDLTPEGYKYVLQGPGSGMYYNGTIYMPIQAWHHEKDQPDKSTATSGFIYSTDNGKTWERVEEDFIPDDVAACESSSLSLNDKVYLVAYTKDKPERRTGVFLTTNTGKHLQIFDTKIDGYTSMSQDLDNLYVFHEGKAGEGEMLFRRFDISAKEYANINAQILNRGTDLLDVQDKLFASRSYLTGEYASQDNSGVEAVILNGNYKIGAFHKNSKENSKDVYRTIEYNTEDTTLVLSQDNVITNNDNIFAGYQYTKLSYLNGSKNDINSFVIGYSLNHKFENDFGYNLGINGIYSNNKLDRNEAEGLGKSASFDSYSISLKNEIYRDIKVQENTNLNLAAGLRTTYFGHDDIKEKNGNGFNDAYVDSSTNFSNEIYLKGSAEHDIRFNEKFAAKIGANVGYNKELMNVDDWRDKFTILDVEKEYARPVEKHSAGVANAGFHLTLDFVDKVETTLAYTVDSTGEGITTGRLTYKF
jgi:sialidase-1